MPGAPPCKENLLRFCNTDLAATIYRWEACWGGLGCIVYSFASNLEQCKGCACASLFCGMAQSFGMWWHVSIALRWLLHELPAGGLDLLQKTEHLQRWSLTGLG